ncbi:hypothetical protein M0805_007497 [Coniferiporia weirii]|nr:hypothetical protein M0805_007497 [Coniferiporia weirii]
MERTVDGNQAFEPETELWVPFKTRSDALLAQMLLQHGLSKIHFNLLMCILLEPSFSLEDVTLRNVTDVDVCISEHRRNLAERRSRACSLTLGHSAPIGMPSIVLDLTLDRMLEDSVHFSYEVDTPADTAPEDAAETKTSVPSNWRADMGRMCLVHRTWTVHAQHALQRRTILTSRKALHRFAHSPACNVGVREFAYKIDRTDACTMSYKRSVAQEHWITLASVLSRLANLRFLCLRIESTHIADLAGLDRAISAIGDLSSLEGLWLISPHDHIPYLPHLYAAVSKLRNLRFLSIFNWTCPRKGRATKDPVPENVLELTPPPHLRTLQIRDGYLVTPTEYLAWLFHPRGKYRPDTLDLQITFSRQRPPADSTTTAYPEQPHLLSALVPLLPSLSTLILKFFYLDTSSASITTVHDADVQAILARATALRRVRLYRLRGGVGVGPGPGPSPLVLPASLEEIHVHFAHVPVNWRAQDRRLHAMLSPCHATLRLRRVVVSAGDGYGELNGLGAMVIATNMPRTCELCAELGLAFVPLTDVYLNRYVVDALL